MNNLQVLALLARQHGVIATTQLTGLGVSARSVHYFRQRGVVEAVLPGVVRAVSHPYTFESRAMAVQLHTAPTGVLSGPTAGRFLGLRQMPSRRIYTVRPQRSRSSLPDWVRRVQSSWLDPDVDVVVVRDVFRVLRPVRMLLTLAEIFNDFRFERAAEDAWHLGLVTPLQAAEFLELFRGQGRRGVKRFERWLERTAARSRPSQSGFELDVLHALRRACLPEPQRQYPLTLASGELIHLDFAWPEAQLAFEPGHTWWHGGDIKMSTDYARDRACGEVGWHVARCDESARNALDRIAGEVARTYATRCRLLSGPRFGS